MLVIDGSRVRPAHPLLAAAARKRSRAGERRELHHALAGAVEDGELRALHLALATDRPDDELAGTIAAAAAAASAHGGREQALRLAEHALRLTPEGSPLRADRLLALGASLEVAGELHRIPEVVGPALDWLPAGPARARAYMLLSEGADVRTSEDFEHYLQLAWDEGEDDPALRSDILTKRAIDMCACTVDRLAEAEAKALEAQAMARARDPTSSASRSSRSAGCTGSRGRSLDALCEQHRGRSASAAYMAESPERVAAQRLVWRGEMDAARAELGGCWIWPTSAASRCPTRCSACTCASASCARERGTRPSGCSTSGPSRRTSTCSSAHVRALPRAAGSGPRAPRGRRGVGGEGRRRRPRGGRMWDQLECARARGIAALLAPDAARAAESLRPAWEHVVREGVTEPGVFPVAPELVEALADLGELDEARAITDRVAEAQDHPWAHVTARRCAAVIALAAGTYDEEAAASWRHAAAEYERARAALRRRAVASRARPHAAPLQAVGRRPRLARGGGRRVRGDRVPGLGGARPGRAGARRSAPPAADRGADADRGARRRPRREGLANKQIAQTLFVTVHTVEVHLSRAYAKLGVRSRSQLAGRLAAKD